MVWYRDTNAPKITSAEGGQQDPGWPPSSAWGSHATPGCGRPTCGGGGRRGVARRNWDKDWGWRGERGDGGRAHAAAPTVRYPSSVRLLVPASRIPASSPPCRNRNAVGHRHQLVLVLGDQEDPGRRLPFGEDPGASCHQALSKTTVTATRSTSPTPVGPCLTPTSNISLARPMPTTTSRSLRVDAEDDHCSEPTGSWQPSIRANDHHFPAPPSATSPIHPDQRRQSAAAVRFPPSGHGMARWRP
jgi:hypothetical protein